MIGQESRNGKIIRDTIIKENELVIVNDTEKCKGVITRVNTANADEKSTIDYVISTQNAYQQITENAY